MGLLTEMAVSDAITRAAFEAQGLDELLEILTASPWSIPSSKGAAIVSIPSDNKPYVSQAKFFPEQINHLNFDLDEVLGLARHNEPVVCDASVGPLASRILELKPEATAAVVSPLRLRGHFYGLLVLAIGSKESFDQDAAWRFAIRVITLAAARYLHEGKSGISHRKAQSEARLTDRQLRITELALRGLSNRNIAQELHLSLGTVKVELGKIYRKLEISARSNLYMPHSDIQLR